MHRSVPQFIPLAGLRMASALVLLSSALLALAPARAGAQTLRPLSWKPIEPADLALKAPVVDPRADAEALLWEVRVFDEYASLSDDPQTIFEHYLRVKIFTERGKDRFATIDLPYTSGVDVSSVSARSIAPDGTIVELKRADTYQRTIVKLNDIKVKAVSFAVPAIAVGSIVEYHWRETHRDSLAVNLPLPFSRDIPVQLVRYFIRPLPETGDYRMILQPFNGEFTPLEQQRDGFSMTTLKNVPAERDEPYPVPTKETQPWLLVSYTDQVKETIESYWTGVSKAGYAAYEERLKGSDELRRAAKEAVKGISDPRAQIQALLRTVRARVTRVDTPGTPPDVVRAAKLNKNAGDAFKRGQGRGLDQLVVFVAMAKAVGLDARIVAAPDRSVLFFKFDRRMSSMVRDMFAAVHVNGEWIFVEPANRMSATGALLWHQEWQPVLVLDPKAAVIVQTPLSPPADTARRRTATLKLLEDGSLEGEVEVAYTGHYGVQFKLSDEEETAEARAASLRETYAKRMPGVELTDVRVENVSDPEKPYVNRFKIRVPGYAQKTGTRLFLQPAVFQKGAAALFTSETREQDVYFPYGWTEEDTLTISLPEDYRIEAPTRPAPVDSSVGRHQLALSSTDSWRTLTVKRSFVYGLTDALLVTRASYPALKKFFDLVQQKDAHTIVLRKREPAQ